MKKIFVLLTFILMIDFSINISNASLGHTTKEGRILFSPIHETLTYLIDYDGNVLKTWDSKYFPGTCSYMLDNNVIMRGFCLNGRSILGSSDGVQKIAGDGTVLWEYINTNAHHDFEVLPDGNVLMIISEHKSMQEAISAGKNPSDVSKQGMNLDYIIEVQPTGPTSGDIVWEWYVWDHLIQDYDSTKDNYGIVSEHPELIDINYQKGSLGFNHINSIDYNPEFNQILVSDRSFHELWIIEHGSDKGLLYRWGNPKAYKRGAEEDQQLYFQHDAQWIKNGYPGEGNILVFNNGDYDIKQSSIIEIKTPVDIDGKYNIEFGKPFGPNEPVWIYENGENFYSSVMSGCQRLLDGNTLICESDEGKFFEVTPDGDIVWEYINPYPNLLLNMVFKIEWLETPHIPDLDCYGNFEWKQVSPGSYLNTTITIENTGFSGTLLDWEIIEYPDWGYWTFEPMNGENLKPEDGPVTVEVSVIAPDEKNTEFTGEVKIVNTDDPADYEIIPVTLTTPKNKMFYQFNILFERLFHFFPFFEKILNQIV